MSPELERRLRVEAGERVGHLVDLAEDAIQADDLISGRELLDEAKTVLAELRRRLRPDLPETSLEAVLQHFVDALDDLDGEP